MVTFSCLAKPKQSFEATAIQATIEGIGSTDARLFFTKFFLHRGTFLEPVPAVLYLGFSVRYRTPIYVYDSVRKIVSNKIVDF